VFVRKNVHLNCIEISQGSRSRFDFGRSNLELAKNLKKCNCSHHHNSTNTEGSRTEYKSLSRFQCRINCQMGGSLIIMLILPQQNSKQHSSKAYVIDKRELTAERVNQLIRNGFGHSGQCAELAGSVSACTVQQGKTEHT
jgi:hypothetical protein